ncbi:MAG: class I adenylate-forming enzyme family protein [Gammaproteobacteria bacterium]
MHSDLEIQQLIQSDFFSIHKEKVLGEELDVFKYRPKSLVEFLDNSRNFGSKPYLIFKDQTITFAEHLELVKKFAKYLKVTFGIAPGDRVAIYAANSIEWIIAFWSIVSLGAVTCALNGWWNGREAEAAIQDAQPKLVLADSKRLQRLENIPKNIINFDDLNIYEISSKSNSDFIKVDEDDCACLLYTSGTTGSPKGVMTSHRSMISNTMLQLLQGAAVAARSTKLGANWTRYRPTSLLTSPLFHVSGLSAGAVTALFAGTTTLIYDGKFDAQRILNLIEDFKVTSWGGAVPTALKRVLDQAELINKKYESVLVIGGGGAPMPPKHIERTKNIFPNSKHNFGYGYGLTESGAITIINWGDNLDAHPDSPGQTMPTINLELRDDKGILVTKDNEEGEIYVKSPSVMLGYYNNPEATSATLHKGRWLKTGDFAYRSNGLYYIVSRRTDLILRGAENVYPQEIEIILDSHPMVVESAVVGIPHDDLGQEVKAIVVLKNDILLEELENYVRSRLAEFKVPSLWEIRNEPFPRNASGKLMKHVILDHTKLTMVEES